MSEDEHNTVSPAVADPFAWIMPSTQYSRAHKRLSWQLVRTGLTKSALRRAYPKIEVTKLADILSALPNFKAPVSLSETFESVVQYVDSCVARKQIRGLQGYKTIQWDELIEEFDPIKDAELLGELQKLKRTKPQNNYRRAFSRAAMAKVLQHYQDKAAIIRPQDARLFSTELNRTGLSEKAVRKAYPGQRTGILVAKLQAMAGFKDPVSLSETFGAVVQYMDTAVARAQLIAMQNRKARIDWRALEELAARGGNQALVEEIGITKTKCDAGPSKKRFPRWMVSELLRLDAHERVGMAFDI